MPEQEVKAGELDEAEEVFDVQLSSGDEAAKVVRPSKQSFHFPAPTGAAQLASILSSSSALPVGREQFDVIFVREFFVERVRVVGFVADEAGGQLVEEASGKNLFHKLALAKRHGLLKDTKSTDAFQESRTALVKLVKEADETALARLVLEFALLDSAYHEPSSGDDGCLPQHASTVLRWMPSRVPCGGSSQRRRRKRSEASQVAKTNYAEGQHCNSRIAACCQRPGARRKPSAVFNATPSADPALVLQPS